MCMYTYDFVVCTCVYIFYVCVLFKSQQLWDGICDKKTKRKKTNKQKWEKWWVFVFILTLYIVSFLSQLYCVMKCLFFVARFIVNLIRSYIFLCVCFWFVNSLCVCVYSCVWYVCMLFIVCECMVMLYQTI